MHGQVAELWRYPVKSMLGEPHASPSPTAASTPIPTTAWTPRCPGCSAGRSRSPTPCPPTPCWTGVAAGDRVEPV
ncbi:hypothetical protein OG271_29385 [Micromonospora rifamycinica]|uniref:hypothetical protein n=1 Tax=Micromonospora rifamycinica TaxID=291594 RepID=UPI002E2D1F33|nr:hypothetical protein [Micromonospora rifamycinica]